MICPPVANQVLESFKKRDGIVNTMLLSKVGDAALDMPDASVIIQISSQGGARMQARHGR